MDDMQSQMGAILNDPDMMQKIMAMAQSLNQQGQEKAPAEDTPQSPEPSAPFSMPDIDLGMIQKISGFARQSNIDNDQRNLLRALHPYLSPERIAKLERAMRAAKMAQFASGALNGFGSLAGR